MKEKLTSTFVGPLGCLAKFCSAVQDFDIFGRFSFEGRDYGSGQSSVMLICV